MRARELRQYQYFLTLAQELHFGRAAQRSNITQSALSQQIGKLEESMGVKLLDRDHRHVRLTRAGEVLRDGAQQMFQVLEETTRRMRLADGFEDYRLAVGMVEYASMSILPYTLSRLQSLYPELKLVRHEMCASKQVGALQRSQIDVGFGGGIPYPHELLPSDGSISSHPMVKSGWRLLMPESHPLASFSRISVHQLCNERIILQARELNPALHDAIRRAFECAGVDPHIVYETSQVQTGIQMARNGLGCMLLAEFIQCGLPPGMRSVPLTDMVQVSMHMFWRTNESNPLVLDFVELAIEAARRQDGLFTVPSPPMQFISRRAQPYLSARG